jgi:hypothetical protein
MSRAQLILNGEEARRKAASWVRQAPVNTRVTFQGPKRSVQQNDKMWAALTDVSEQLTWHGQKLSADDFKCIFIAGLKQELRAVPNLQNNGFITLGRSSSDLSKEEMSLLIELIISWGIEHGVVFQDEVVPA